LCGEEVNAALDAVAVAHIAISLEPEIASSADWHHKAESSIERLVDACLRYDGTNEDPEAEERLNIALDAFAFAHVAKTFEWATGPLKW
jgi:hypothetical protein